MESNQAISIKDENELFFDIENSLRNELYIYIKKPMTCSGL